MAIDKKRNANIQVTFPKEDAANLDALVKAYSNNNIKTTRSGILLVAFRNYLRKLVEIGHSLEKKPEIKEEGKKA